MAGMAYPESRLECMEDHWDKLDRQIKGCSNRPKSVKELACLLQIKWIKVPLSITQTLMQSMAWQVRAVIASGVGSTNY
ncbi:hypothetical protein TNCV_5052241 [Trichonephila clavipes]|nr:hypothetical protein TNCV_5052241 [Trichonephila clavipes]